MQNIFWIVIYCLNPNFCYVSKDLPDSVHKYATYKACTSEIFDGKQDPDPLHPTLHHEVHKNSLCYAVTDVTCFNGGSRCSFTPADNKAIEKLQHVAPIPK